MAPNSVGRLLRELGYSLQANRKDKEGRSPPERGAQVAYLNDQALPSEVKVFAFDPGLVPGKGLVRRGSPISQFIFRRILPALTHTPLPVVPTSPVALRRAY